MKTSYAEELAKRERELIRIRRMAVGEAPLDGEPRVGLALSGGGIRSATFSLGLIQVLAEKGLLPRIDFLSTVSGGGYVGSFLGRLFTRPWVTGFFTEEDFLKPDPLVDQLRNSAEPLAQSLWKQVKPGEDKVLTEGLGSVAEKRKKKLLATVFNRFLRNLWSREPGQAALPETVFAAARECYGKTAPRPDAALVWGFRLLIGRTFACLVTSGVPEGHPDLPLRDCSGAGRVQGELRNTSRSLRFLRDNGRYLAPNGAGDTWIMVAVFLRNWLSTLTVLLTLVLSFFLLVTLVRGLLWNWGWSEGLERLLAEATDKHLWWSPLLALPALSLALLLIPLGWAYWLTQRTWSKARAAWWRETVERVAIITPCLVFAGALLLGLLAPGPGFPKIGGWWLTIEAGLALVFYGLFYLKARSSGTERGVDHNYQVRNQLSSWLSGALSITVLLVAIALVDTVGQTFYAVLCQEGNWGTALKALAGGAGLSAMALGASRLKFLLDKLPKNRAVQVPVELVATLAAIGLVSTLLLLTSLGAHAVAWAGKHPAPQFNADSVTPLTIQPGTNLVAWMLPANTNAVRLTPDNYVQVVPAPVKPSPPEGVARPRILPLALALLAATALSFFFGRTLAFVNLSGLHALYTARLTRAYLGASNSKRWPDDSGRAAQRISDPVVGDDVEWKDYEPWLGGGPLHLVNVTINETISGKNQIEYRDRKGLILGVGPCGLSAGASDHAIWDYDTPAETDRPFVTIRPLDAVAGQFHALGVAAGNPPRGKPAPGRPHPCESASVGRWVGISGAAFTTGLGYRTSLAKSLLLGLLNVRLGYWWTSGVGYRERAAAAACTPLRRANLLEQVLAWLFPVQTHLLQELTARFQGPAMERWYLSDGGHFENTAVYELLRRRVPFIIASDNGCDPDYAFEDAANLVRKARIDFGAEIEFLPAAALTRLGAPAGLESLIGLPEDFRLEQKSGEDKPASAPRAGHALLARAVFPPLRSEGAQTEGGLAKVSYILFLKPSLSGDEPLDVVQYQREHPEFPNESTADQFFDEAQWESYRKLGEHIARTIFAGEPEQKFWFQTLGKGGTPHVVARAEPRKPPGKEDGTIPGAG